MTCQTCEGQGRVQEKLDGGFAKPSELAKLSLAQRMLVVGGNPGVRCPDCKTEKKEVIKSAAETPAEEPPAKAPPE